MFEKKLGEIRPNQFITTYGPGAIMDAVHDYWILSTGMQIISGKKYETLDWPRL